MFIKGLSKHAGVLPVLLPIFVSRFSSFGWVGERGHALNISITGNFVGVEKARNRRNGIAGRCTSLSPDFPLTAMKIWNRRNGGRVVALDAAIAVLLNPRSTAFYRNLWGAASLVSTRSEV